MAQLTVVYWRDIPAQVIVKQGRTAAKRQLAERFEKAIDRAAMRAELRDTDSYLAEWRRAEPVACGDDLEAEAAAAAAESWKRNFHDERLNGLVANGGVAGTAEAMTDTGDRFGGPARSRCCARAFVLTAETSPPDAASAGRGAGARRLPEGAGRCGQRHRWRRCAGRICRRIAGAAILAQHGIEPVLQFTVRDRNRLALAGRPARCGGARHSQHPLPPWRRSEEGRPAGDQAGLRHRQPRP